MTLTTQELQTKLWQAADILRGQIDSADYKNYIFSMLDQQFLKRLSDRFDEEVEAAVAAGVPREAALADMDEHQFAVPPEAHWNQICSTPMNLGEALERGGQRAIEEANSGRLEEGDTHHPELQTKRQAADILRGQIDCRLRSSPCCS